MCKHWINPCNIIYLIKLDFCDSPIATISIITRTQVVHGIFEVVVVSDRAS